MSDLPADHGTKLLRLRPRRMRGHDSLLKCQGMSRRLFHYDLVCGRERPLRRKTSQG